MELGASIFVSANKNLWRATEEFGLSRYNFENDDAQDDETGIWDGEAFVLRMGAGNDWMGSWWNTLKVLWRENTMKDNEKDSMYSNPIRHV